MEYPVLSNIRSPEDVKALPSAQLPALCEEIRKCIIETVSKNGGHLASNLGVVELTVALHRAFSSPEDAIIFDVGHQSYTHKLLTGRFDRFSTIRTENGLSGFMRPDESEHDPFITGHSSNSISAAYGIYRAKGLKGEKGTAVAVIGDGALTGGMAYEALNNAGNENGNFVVVLNDNEMSISKNVGSLAYDLAKLRNRPKYHNFKFALSSFLLKIPFVGKGLHSFFLWIKESLKALVYKKNIFTAMGFNYLGPVNGHDIGAMESLFKIAASYPRPCLVHVITTKGKGYELAEKQPHSYHGVSPFDVKVGAQTGGNSFSSVAGNTLCRLAETDELICAVTAAMAEGTGLSEFSKQFKDRFFDVGIAEQHGVTFSCGLAKEGLKPYFAVYSTFLQRGFDQIIHDAAIANLPIRLLIDRAGIVGEDGETHQGVFDVSYLKCIPNMTVYSPATFKELEYRIMDSAEKNIPYAIRYPRGGEGEAPEFDIIADYDLIYPNRKNLIVTYGRLFAEASAAADELGNTSILKLNKIYPVADKVYEIISSFDRVFFYEETEKSGGIGETVAEELMCRGYKGKFSLYAIENKFVKAATVRAALEANGLDKKSIIKAINDK